MVKCPHRHPVSYSQALCPLVGWRYSTCIITPPKWVAEEGLRQVVDEALSVLMCVRGTILRVEG